MRRVNATRPINATHPCRIATSLSHRYITCNGGARGNSGGCDHTRRLRQLTITSNMGIINLQKRQAKILEERKKENNIKNAINAFERGEVSSIRKAAEAYGVHYSTLNRRLKGIDHSQSKKY